MTAAMVASLVGVSLALVLALRAVRSHRQPPRTLMLWAAIWIGVIIALAFALQRHGLG